MSGVASRQLVLAGFYPPPFGGESVHVFGLARRLARTGSLKAVINLRRGAEPSSEYVRGAGAARLIVRLTGLLDDRTIAHVHSNGHSWRSWRIIAAAALVLRLRRRSPGILTVHSGMAPTFVERCSSAERS